MKKKARKKQSIICETKHISKIALQCHGITKWKKENEPREKECEEREREREELNV